MDLRHGFEWLDVARERDRDVQRRARERRDLAAFVTVVGAVANGDLEYERASVHREPHGVVWAERRRRRLLVLGDLEPDGQVGLAEAFLAPRWYAG